MDGDSRGWQRLEQSGVYLTTCESLLFQLLEDAKHPKFKEVSNAVFKCARVDTGLENGF